jgi:glycosyltransferase involved in cell wall biosynthesis
VIVADANSDDETVRLAEESGCRVIPGGQPAVGRNNGAEAARAKSLLFIDADAYPSQSLLAHSLQRSLSSTFSVTCYRHIPISDDWFVRASYSAADVWFKALRRIGIQHALTNYVLVERATFESVGGFAEDRLPGEDVDFVYRSAKVSSVAYERGTTVLVSARRFRSENAGLFALKSILWEALILAHSSRCLFDYRWPGHSRTIAREEHAWLGRHGYPGGAVHAQRAAAAA